MASIRFKLKLPRWKMAWLAFTGQKKCIDEWLRECEKRSIHTLTDLINDMKETNKKTFEGMVKMVAQENAILQDLPCFTEKEVRLAHAIEDLLGAGGNSFSVVEELMPLIKEIVAEEIQGQDKS